MHVVFLFGSHIETQLVDNVKNMLDCGDFLNVKHTVQSHSLNVKHTV